MIGVFVCWTERNKINKVINLLGKVQIKYDISHAHSYPESEIIVNNVAATA